MRLRRYFLTYKHANRFITYPIGRFESLEEATEYAQIQLSESEGIPNKAEIVEVRPETILFAVAFIVGNRVQQLLFGKTEGIPKVKIKPRHDPLLVTLKRGINKFARIVIRTLRIAVGGGLVFALYMWWDNSDSLLDIPLAELTLKAIFSGIFFGVLYCIALLICWFIAFGEKIEK